jgi:hypothetical protein
LTENQPVSYIEQLAKYTQPTILLVVVPDAREQMSWRELSRKLKDAGISAEGRDDASGIVYSVSTNKGPILALTSWKKLIDALELEAVDDQAARSDLVQLRALCKAADTDHPAKPVAQHFKHAANVSPSPGGEGRGEDGRQ